MEHLELGEPVETPWSVLDPDARPLGAPERLMGGERQVGVRPDGPALEAFGDRGGALGIARPDRAGESEVGGVGSFDDLVQDDRRVVATELEGGALEVDSGVCGDGSSTIVFPALNAGAIFRCDVVRRGRERIRCVVERRAATIIMCDMCRPPRCRRPRRGAGRGPGRGPLGPR